jgi:hypothetical protein
MGVDIHITVPHNVADVSLSTVIVSFRSLDGLFEEISRHYSQWVQFKTPSEAWRDVSDPSYGRPYLFQAPTGFTFSFGPRVLSIYHVTRFHHFCTEPDARHLLRRFTYRVLQLMSGEQAIYSPDQGIGDEIYDLVFDGLSFADIEAHLLRLGAPAASFAEMDARRAPQPRYYIDRFEDFYVETTSAV